MRNALSLAGVALVVAACAAVPRTTHELESARAAYRTAAASPEVQARAPFELQAAERALGDAERFQQSDGDPARVVHFSYLAEQLSRIAMKTAEMRAAEAKIATAGEQRNRLQTELAALERARFEAAAAPKQAQPQATPLASEIKRLETGASGFTSRETDRGWVLTFGSTALFDSGAATLTPEGRKAVQGLAQVMKQHPARGIAVEGYTDSGGSAERSRQLSQARADAVKQALIEHGVDPNHVWTRAYGSEFPLATKERVDVVIAQPATASSGATTR
jgi:outer membrane protein OmpA-like peptidoglycan-associated protein